ncbi:AraC family transcriptional regulator [Thalassolituus sp. LLYu03]|uniref:AraC family transcriptional regulator n=1 Tax=Thalassolituus sp. LLYu03 TaxID=3421656 RepID=UPI003D2AE1B8
MSASPTTIAAWALAICKALRASGFDPAPLLDEQGLDLAQLEKEPESRIAIDTMTRFWLRVEERTGNPAFGLEVARHVQPMHFRALGLLMLTSDNMATVVDKLGRYHAMISNSVNIRVIYQPDRVGFAVDPLAGVPISPLAVDGFFATLMGFARQLTGHDTPLLGVDLMRPQPADSGPWARCYHFMPQFQQATNCLWFDRRALQLSEIAGDPHLAVANEAQVKLYLQKMNALSWRERVRNSVQALLEQGEPTLADVAGLLTVSERSLRRHLQQENTSFRECLTEVRSALAAFYLTDTDHNLTEISLRLGFSDSANFSKAFQRWYGLAPGQYRLQKRADGND